jgi:hypothetical protein
MKYKPIQSDDQSVYLTEDPQPEDLANPFHARFGWILRFLVSMVFGCFVSLFVFLVLFFWYSLPIIWGTKYIHIFWIIPIVWGFLGIFIFDEMIDIPRKLFRYFIRTD